MNEIRESKRRIERDRNRKENLRVEREARRLRNLPAERGKSPKERLRRLERIGDRDALRHLPEYDVRRAEKLEKMEIETNPKGFLRRHAGEGLDPATEREVRNALRHRESQ